MPEMPCPSLYESPALRAVTGSALRPGGLELTQRALSHCGLPIGSLVADIGCGVGATVRYLRQDLRLNAFGLDRSSGMLDQARQRNSGSPLIQAEAQRLPVSDGCLSAVMCECVLSLVADIDSTWQEFYRVLSPGGFLVLTDVYSRAPKHAIAPASLPVNCCLKGATSRHELLQRMHRSGFALLVWEDHSEALKRLAAQLVFACGSLQALWETIDAGASANGSPATTYQVRPGYFLAVARKEGRS
jgi:arsenite methyltransferase